MTDTLTKVPHIPADAPFSGDQKQWLSGFLAGLHSRLAVGGGQAAPTAQVVETKPLDVIFGTQTGNAEAVAEDVAVQAKAKGFTPRVAEMDEISTVSYTHLTLPTTPYV